jgi:hypothetical protein
MAIMLPTLGEDRRATYSPFLPISPKTGRVLQVPTLARDLGRGTIMFQDEDGEEELGSGSEEKEGPGKPGDKPGDKPGQGQGKPGDKPGEGEGDKDGEANLIGKKVRITEGPDAGKEGTIKQVLPNGDIIIE